MTGRPRTVRTTAAAVPAALLLLMVGGCSHYHVGIPLVRKLEGSPNFHDLAHILFDQALLAEGGMPDDPAAYVRRVNSLLV